MAYNTPLNLRNMVIYEVYVRNHGETGKFEDVKKDLKRIKALGTDVVWFMPIHPIGVKNKKGDLGCPYSIKDYRKVNPEYGTPQDFKALIDEIHSHGMLSMIDVVYNHTSRDSYLLENYPQYFYRNPQGDIGNKVGDWSDVCDLDYSRGGRELYRELIETLKYWASLGVDGFRCDVASLVPVDFWLEARSELAEINPNLIWLSETVHPQFILELRSRGHLAQSDCEIFTAFDISYDYDVYDDQIDAICGKAPLKNYLDLLKIQEYIYPGNYVKLRFLENHDQKRARSFITDSKMLNMWTAFTYFQKGATLIYAGQETHNTHTPSLFDIDRINWSTLDLEYSDYLKKLGSIKKMNIFADGNYVIHDNENIIHITYEDENSILAGIFNVNKLNGNLKTNLPDGNYKNLIDDTNTFIQNGEIILTQTPVILEIPKSR